jgi:hypothetical protein
VRITIATDGHVHVKIQRQPRLLVKAADRRTRGDALATTTTRLRPSARPRSSAGNALVTIAMFTEKMAAAPRARKQRAGDQQILRGRRAAQR